jgi:hypothetical protein
VIQALPAESAGSVPPTPKSASSIPVGQGATAGPQRGVPEHNGDQVSGVQFVAATCVRDILCENSDTT